MRMALKVDVDTLRGTREGVPALMALFERLGIGATFLFSVGPDHTGRALRRLFRPGFLAKVLRTSVPSVYGLKTLTYGTLLPGPDMGREAAGPMRAARDAGFEVGLHSWDHVRWQDAVARKDRAWTEREWSRGVEAWTGIFGTAPKCFGAAGWQANKHVFALESDADLDWASDTRGTTPFRARLEDGPGGIQIPTTLPTMDEIIGRQGVTAENVGPWLVETVRNDPRALHVFTLHAELEGGPLLDAFEQALRGWLDLGLVVGSVGEAVAELDPTKLPLLQITTGRVPGRAGTLMAQPPHTSGANDHPHHPSASRREDANGNLP